MPDTDIESLSFPLAGWRETRPLAPARAAARNPWIDGLRVVAALAIVWFHAGAPGAKVAYTGLSVFLIVTFYFESQKPEPTPLPRLASRYLLPWIFWFAFYGLVRIATHGQFFPDYRVAWPAKILAGTSLPLWYLPFVFILLSIVGAALNGPMRKHTLAFAATAATAYLMGVSWLYSSALQIGPPAVQYVQALPAVLLGLALGSARGDLRARWVVGVLATALVSIGLLTPVEFGLQDALAAVLVVGALFLGGRVRGRAWGIASLSPLTYGVYLIHPFFLSLSKIVVGGNRSFQAILASIVAFGAVWIIRRHGGRFGRSVT